MKKTRLEYLAPDLEVCDLGDDLITTSREWDTEEMPIPQNEPPKFAW